MCAFIKISPVLVAALALSGCAVQPAKETTLVHKTGSTIYSKQRDFDECKIASFRSIPQAIGHRTYGGSYDPGRTECVNINGSLSCRNIGAYYSPPQISNFDMNQRLRNDYVDRCIAAKGYKRYVKPYCDDDTGYSNREPAPPISKIACINRKRTLHLER